MATTSLPIDERPLNVMRVDAGGFGQLIHAPLWGYDTTAYVNAGGHIDSASVYPYGISQMMAIYAVAMSENVPLVSDVDTLLKVCESYAHVCTFTFWNTLFATETFENSYTNFVNTAKAFSSDDVYFCAVDWETMKSAFETSGFRDGEGNEVTAQTVENALELEVGIFSQKLTTVDEYYTRVYHVQSDTEIALLELMNASAE